MAGNLAGQFLLLVSDAVFYSDTTLGALVWVAGTLRVLVHFYSRIYLRLAVSDTQAENSHHHRRSNLLGRPRVEPQRLVDWIRNGNAWPHAISLPACDSNR